MIATGRWHRPWAPSRPGGLRLVGPVSLFFPIQLRFKTVSISSTSTFLTFRQVVRMVFLLGGLLLLGRPSATPPPAHDACVTYPSSQSPFPSCFRLVPLHALKHLALFKEPVEFTSASYLSSMPLVSPLDGKCQSSHFFCRFFCVFFSLFSFSNLTIVSLRKPL